MQDSLYKNFLNTLAEDIQKRSSRMKIPNIKQIAEKQEKKARRWGFMAAAAAIFLVMSSIFGIIGYESYTRKNFIKSEIAALSDLVINSPIFVDSDFDSSSVTDWFDYTVLEVVE